MARLTGMTSFNPNSPIKYFIFHMEKLRHNKETKQFLQGVNSQLPDLVAIGGVLFHPS